MRMRIIKALLATSVPLSNLNLIAKKSNNNNNNGNENTNINIQIANEEKHIKYMICF